MIAGLYLSSAFEEDRDADLVPDSCDLCPDTASESQLDSDGDGQGDACDPCPFDSTNDSDGDGICAPTDACPFERGLDTDGDGLCPAEDNCPKVFNPMQIDVDQDGVGNACDGDLDDDGKADERDLSVFWECEGRELRPGAGPADDPTCEESDLNTDAQVDEIDRFILLNLIPEPDSAALGFVAIGALAALKRYGTWLPTSP